MRSLESLNDIFKAIDNKSIESKNIIYSNDLVFFFKKLKNTNTLEGLNRLSNDIKNDIKKLNYCISSSLYRKQTNDELCNISNKYSKEMINFVSYNIRSFEKLDLDNIKKWFHDAWKKVWNFILSIGKYLRIAINFAQKQFANLLEKFKKSSYNISKKLKQIKVEVDGQLKVFYLSDNSIMKVLLTTSENLANKLIEQADKMITVEKTLSKDGPSKISVEKEDLNETLKNIENELDSALYVNPTSKKPVTMTGLEFFGVNENITSDEITQRSLNVKRDQNKLLTCFESASRKIQKSGEILVATLKTMDKWRDDPEKLNEYTENLNNSIATFTALCETTKSVVINKMNYFVKIANDINGQI